MTWFVGAGMCIAIITINSVVNGAILAALWLIELLYWGPFHDNGWLRAFYMFPTVMWIYQGDTVSLPAWYFQLVWLIPHLEQLAMAFLLLLAGWFLLQHTEHLLKGTTTE
ncbi:hypothetical protein KDK_62070 [Dictyobacter kobayashii]|uniref:Uncharacterized protein n=1 Tax=Dictyobacter kobayashii TaxID=2014872 RepID=A0A402ATI1_9CHLR|nr:hypothetical protein KDK_62070 [Dictyobacter kobayashii]